MIFPEPERTSAFTAKSETAPPASSKTFPAPCAETATPSAKAVPSVSVKFPAKVRKTTEPSPPVVRTSESAASVTGVTDPSAATRCTVTLTVPTVNAFVATTWTPLDPPRALSVPAATSIPFAPPPSVPIPTPATRRNPLATTSVYESPPSKIEPFAAMIETCPPVQTPPSVTLPAARNRTFPLSAKIKLASPIPIEPPAASTKTVPIPPVSTPVPANVTFLPARKVTFPDPERTSAFTAKSETAPPASSKTFPVPCAETATPSAGPTPSVNPKLPTTVRNTIDPFPPVVAASDCPASVKAVNEPSAITRCTVTLTVPTTNAFASKTLTPPPPARALKIIAFVRNGIAPAPNVPIPVPADKRKPPAVTSIPPADPREIEPSTAVIEAFPAANADPKTTSSAARKRR